MDHPSQAEASAAGRSLVEAAFPVEAPQMVDRAADSEGITLIQSKSLRPKPVALKMVAALVLEAAC
jgi:hypothetical protein